jgi:hypothetical protein
VARVEETLRTSDLVKFAGLAPTPDRIAEAPAALRQLIIDLDTALNPAPSK